MLLAYQIPPKQLQWFSAKGILVRRCDQVIAKGRGVYPPVVYNKCFMFMPEFKQWDNVLYLDADIIVRASIDRLGNVKGFHAVEDLSALEKQSKNNYLNLRGKAFCTGVMAFSTDIIRQDTCLRLEGLCKETKDISVFGEQLAFNLFFYKRWRRLPILYGTFMCTQRHKSGCVKGVILHFASCEKPWDPESFFYAEWAHNLAKADLMDLLRPCAGEAWGGLLRMFYSLCLHYNCFCGVVDRLLGRAGRYARRKLSNIIGIEQCKSERGFSS